MSNPYGFPDEAPKLVFLDQNGYDFFSGEPVIPASVVPLLEKVVIISSSGTYVFG